VDARLEQLRPQLQTTSPSANFRPSPR
jgi:hypothetical protein